MLYQAELSPAGRRLDVSKRGFYVPLLLEQYEFFVLAIYQRDMVVQNWRNNCSLWLLIYSKIFLLFHS